MDSELEPLWMPDEATVRASNLWRLMEPQSFRDYDRLHSWSIREPEAFWRQTLAMLGIVFRTPPQRMLDLSEGVRKPKWLPGARLNIVESCLRGAADDVAVLHGCPGRPTARISRKEFARQVRTIAASIRQAGYPPGARLAIVMPMTPESAAIYLGILFAGCVAVCIADSFAAEEIGKRLRIAEASAVICVQSFLRGGKRLELYDRIRDAAPPTAIVLPPPDGSQGTGRLRAGDRTWSEFLHDGELTEPYLADPDSMITILFSSGTTGDPKAIPWTQMTPIKCAMDACFHHDVRAGDTVVWPTNLGWMMGPWLIFASQINQAAMGLFDDITQAADFGRFIEDSRTTMLGVVPTLIRQWRGSRCMEGRDWSSIRCFSSTGEASNPSDMRYLSGLAGGKPVIEYCGGTEIGGGYITSSVLHPNVPAAFSCPALGSSQILLGDDGRPADEGELFLIPPALGLSTSLLNRDHDATYFTDCPAGPHGEVLRRHGDYFRRLPSGHLVAGGRVDDTMNLGGIKVSSAELETVMNAAEGVRETAAVAFRSSPMGPEELAVFVVVQSDPAAVPGAAAMPDLDSLRRQFNRLLRERLNPLFRVARVLVVPSLPRTASNKVMRRELRTTLDTSGSRLA